MKNSKTESSYIVLGAKGYVGRRMVRFLENKNESVTALSHADVDYTDSRVFEKWIEFNKPRWKNQRVFIINCAGKTGSPNVDQCEIRKADTIRLNIVLPIMLSDACERHGLIFCHFSSGCIYQGGKDRVFTEEDVPNFSYDNKSYSFYSGSKVIAEDYVLKNPTSYVWRIHMPFDERNVGKNYLSKMLKYSTLINAHNSLTHLGDLTNTCYDMMRTSAPPGLYNMVNPGLINTKRIVEIMKEELKLDTEFKFFDSLEEFGTTVATPRSNCIISPSKVNSIPSVTPFREIEDALRDALRKWC
jgi:dTDP-4-dehydrorhamnose reductase